MACTINDVKSTKLSSSEQGEYTLSGTISHHCTDGTDIDKLYLVTFSVEDGSAVLRGFGEAQILEETMRAFNEREGLDVHELLLSNWEDVETSFESEQFLFRAMISTIAHIVQG